MSRRPKDSSSWFLDQLAKSRFFHQKLHEWGLLEIAEALEAVRGELLEWKLDQLGIQQEAWNKVIHSGIKPILLFAHPEVLTSVRRSVAYYRMMAVVSQKSMTQIGLDTIAFEEGSDIPSEETAIRIAAHLNKLISQLILGDAVLNRRELDLWRGMAAGTQAQGSWQNQKGREIEQLVFGIIRDRVRTLMPHASLDANKITLPDGRTIQFGSDPDIALLNTSNEYLVVVEVKGGIDPAGVLERLGASIKSLQPIKQTYPACITVLLLRRNALTERVKQQIEQSTDIDYYFIIEDLFESFSTQSEFFQVIGL